MKSKLMLIAAGTTVIIGAVVLPAMAGVSRDSQRNRSRVVALSYENPTAVSVPTGRMIGRTTVTADTLKADRFVTVQIIDANGAPVSASLTDDRDGDTITGEEGETRVDFCGAITKRVPVKPGLLFITIGLGTCPDGTPSVPSSGEVRFTFESSKGSK